MNTKDNYMVVSFKMLLASIAIVIMIPMIDNTSDISFYVSVCVYVLGKFIDLLVKLSEKPIKQFFIVYQLGVIVGIVVISICFFVFADMSVCTIKVNWALFILTVVFASIELMELIYCFCKLYNTKKKLKQF